MCCDLVLGGGREGLSPGPGGREGGVVTWSWGEGGRCCDLVLGGGGEEGGVVT